MIEGLQNALDNVLRAMRVDRIALFVQNYINKEQRELGLGSSERFDLLWSIVSINDLEGIFDFAADWQKLNDTVNKAMD